MTSAAGGVTLPGWLQRLTGGAGLPVDRVRSRITAYVYGNILVLAAVLETGTEDVESGFGLVLVLVTTVTTYLAHVLAHDIGSRVGRSADEHHEHLRSELRDAVPIATSGLAPCVPLAIGALGWWSADVSLVVAAAIVAVRLGATGWIVGRLTGRTARFAWWSGLALAAAGGVVAILEVVLLH